MAVATATILAGAALGLAAKSAFQKVPKPPKAEALPPIPKTVDPKIGETVRRQRQMSTAGGRSSTLLTGSKGLKSEPQAQRKTLLGY